MDQIEQERIQSNLGEKLDTTEQLEPDSTNAEKTEKEDNDKDKKKDDSGSESGSDRDDKKKVWERIGQKKNMWVSGFFL